MGELPKPSTTSLFKMQPRILLSCQDAKWKIPWKKNEQCRLYLLEHTTALGHLNISKN
jgi:hypothetical protein